MVQVRRDVFVSSTRPGVRFGRATDAPQISPCLSPSHSTTSAPWQQSPEPRVIPQSPCCKTPNDSPKPPNIYQKNHSPDKLVYFAGRYIANSFPLYGLKYPPLTATPGPRSSHIFRTYVASAYGVAPATCSLSHGFQTTWVALPGRTL